MKPSYNYIAPFGARCRQCGVSDDFAEYVALRGEIAIRVSMVSEQGFSTAIAMFAVFSMYVALGCAAEVDGTVFFLLDCLLELIASFYLLLAAIKSGENIRQIIKLSTYCRVIYEGSATGFNWETYLDVSADKEALAHNVRLQYWYNKEYFSIAVASLASFVVNLAIAWLRGIAPSNTFSAIVVIAAVVAVAVTAVVCAGYTFKHTSARGFFADYAAACARSATAFAESHPESVRGCGQPGGAR